MMKINKLGFLSCLALLGILGLFKEHRGMMGFFGFAYYIRYFFVIPDEMFLLNVRQAASIGFFTGSAVTSLAIIIRILFPAILTSNMVLASCYIVSMFIFTLVLTSLEIKEQRR